LDYLNVLASEMPGFAIFVSLRNSAANAGSRGSVALGNSQAIRKHPVGMKPKIGKGSVSHPQSSTDKATSLRLLRGAPFGLKAEVLNQQGKLINKPPIWSANLGLYSSL
jgi:hypothetical protein